MIPLPQSVLAESRRLHICMVPSATASAAVQADDSLRRYGGDGSPTREGCLSWSTAEQAVRQLQQRLDVIWRRG